MMQRCSERAFAMCPYRKECGTIYEATFSDNSDCAEFNRKVDSMPMTNGDRIRAMTDEELAKVLNAFTEYYAECNRSIADIDCHDCELCELCSLGEGKAIEWLKQPAEVDHDL